MRRRGNLVNDIAPRLALHRLRLQRETRGAAISGSTCLGWQADRYCHCAATQLHGIIYTSRLAHARAAT